MGIVINDNTRCIRRQKEENIKQARKMANMTFSVMHKTCNKIMIRKLYSKSVVLTHISVLYWTRSDLEVLRKIESGVWQMMLGIPGYALFSGTLQDEVTASGMVARHIKLKLGHQKYLCEN